jgi:hypothetical protein
MNRSLVLAVLGLAVLAAPAGADRGSLREQSQRDFPAAGLRAVRVENARGLIEVRRGEPARVRLTALKVVRAPVESRRDLAREMGVETQVRDGVLEVRVRYPQGRALRISFWDVMRGVESPRAEIRLELEVPPGFAADLRSASGDLRTAGLDGAQTLTTTSGDIGIEDAGGPVEARATSGSVDATGLRAARLTAVSGDVVVDGVRGPLQARTTSGGISVRGAADSLRLDSVSGDIRIDAAPRGLTAGTTSGEISARSVQGVLRLSTSSGDVVVHAAPGLARAEIGSVSGDIAVEMPAGLGATIDLSTSSGALDAAVGLEVQSVTRHALRGTVGDGRARVQLKSSSGDIQVTMSGGNIR